ncbi:MAG: cyclic nucleotide-binding domain-containing protein [Spirochaetes bacterium]|nr:cyclic nucleotide-binding domain-containing protein [Spirochaetota bacterium]
MIYSGAAWCRELKETKYDNVFSTALTISIAVLPVPVIYLFYRRYFSAKPGFLHKLEYCIYGVILGLMILIGASALGGPFSLKDNAALGFLGAAMVEKGGAFIFIAVLMFRPLPITMALNFTVSAMLLGLGFATMENVVYALALPGPVIAVRLLSAVPLHVLTCGMIGYFLAMARFSGSKRNRYLYTGVALVVPFLFHGAYDTLLFRGGVASAWIAPLLIVLIVWMEYLLAKSQTLPLLDGLIKHGIGIEEWRMVQREPQYERWIRRSMGSRSRNDEPVFRVRPGRSRWAVIILLLIIAAAAIPTRDHILAFMGYRIQEMEALMIFCLLPALYSLNLLAVGVVNPRYFQEGMLRIPIIIDVDAMAQNRTIKTISYHVEARGFFMKTIEPVTQGEYFTLAFSCGGFSSPLVPGRAVWVSDEDHGELSGVVVRVMGSSARFRLFLLKYGLYRLTRGIFFNLRLPGFRSVRRLFVRPVSVMEGEHRFAAGTRLFEQGDEGGSFYLIRKGEVDIVKNLDGGERVHLATMTEGEIFGEMAIVGRQPRLASAVCRTDCLLAVADADDLDALIEGNPEFTRRLIGSFANRLHDSERTMMKNIKESEDAFKNKEAAYLLALKAIALARGTGGEGSRSGSDDRAEEIAGKIEAPLETVRELLGIITECTDPGSFEEALRRFVEKNAGS